jgi:hypothetical protein
MGGRIFKPLRNIYDTVADVGKKALTETFDTVTGLDKEERRYLLYGETPVETPEVTPEVTPEIVPDDDSIMGRRTRRTKGKRAGQAGTIIEGYGSLYRGGSSKAVGK